MKPLSLVLLLLTASACAHAAGRQDQDAAEARAELWHDGHLALYAYAFARADSVFTRLATEHPNSTEGREAMFYVGSLHLDPRNPQWSSERTEAALHRYLQQDTVGTLIHRRPEATTMLALARELNRPEEERIPPLRSPAPTPAGDQPEAGPPPPAQLRTLQEEVTRLRRMVEQRDEQIRQQREELERIRRVLTPPRTPQP